MSLITYNGESKVIKRICELLDTMSGINFEVVQTLPLVDISTSTIYLVPKQSAEVDNIYDEYINTDGTSQGWELIGTTEIDLSNYYTKTEVDNLIPDELADLSDDTTHRLVTDTEKSTWNGKSDTDENVKQVFTDSTNTNFNLIGSYSDSQGDETNTVKKVAHAYINGRNGNLTVCRKHTALSLNNNTVTIGNDIPEGTSGNVNGILKLFGKGEYFVQFYDQNNYLTNNRNYMFRDINGMMCLFSDVTDFAVMSNLNVLDNLIYPIYNHSSGSTGGISYSTNFETGEYTVKGSHTSNVALQIKRYSQGFYLPAGRYKLSGCPSGGSSSKYSLRIYKSTEGGTTTGIGSDYGSGLEFTLTERTLMQITFYINANNSVDFTFRPKLERLSEWVDLGNTSLGTITVDDVYSEYRAEVTLDCSYGGTTYTRNFMYNFLSDSLSSTAKSFIQTAPCQTQQIGGVVYMHCSTSAKKENNQVTIASGGTWTGGLGGTASPLFTLPTIQLYAKV